ncbi:MAG: c-type cytochrome [Candidatus Obscuribacterales bacterium]
MTMVELTLARPTGRLLKYLFVVSFVIAILVCAIRPARGDEAAVKLYNDKCSGCHTIGGGNLVGPDLSSSQKASDIDLTKAVKRMEANVGPLSDDEVNQLVKFIKEPKAAAQLKGDGSTLSKTESPVEQPTSESAKSQELKELGSSDIGAKLFDGRAAFKNGGVSCVACHQAEGVGGSLGPDLTHVANKMNEVALASACEHTAYKIMKPTYQDHKISRQEALDLARYLKAINDRSKSKLEPPVVLYGLGFALGVIGLIALGYGKRNKSILKKLKGN